MDLAMAGSQSKAVLTKSLTDYAFFSLFIHDRFIIPICQAGEVPINYTRQTSARGLPGVRPNLVPHLPAAQWRGIRGVVPLVLTVMDAPGGVAGGRGRAVDASLLRAWGLEAPALIWGLICIVDVVIKSILHGRAEGFPCCMGCVNAYAGSTFLSDLSLQNRKKGRQLVWSWVSELFSGWCVVGESHRDYRVPRAFVNICACSYLRLCAIYRQSCVLLSMATWLSCS